MSSAISIKEMINRFEDFFCQGKYVSVVCDYEFGKMIIGTEQLEVYDNGDNITFDDVNDTHLLIDRSYIRGISLSRDFINEIITIDVGDSKLSFVTNN